MLLTSTAHPIKYVQTLGREKLKQTLCWKKCANVIFSLPVNMRRAVFRQPDPLSETNFIFSLKVILTGREFDKHGREIYLPKRQKGREHY